MLMIWQYFGISLGSALSNHGTEILEHRAVRGNETKGLYHRIEQPHDKVKYSLTGSRDLRFQNMAIYYHHVFGHASPELLRKLNKLGYIHIPKDDWKEFNEYRCKGCFDSITNKIGGKNQKDTFSRIANRPIHFGEEMSADLRDYGANYVSREGYRYALFIKDHAKDFTMMVKMSRKTGEMLHEAIKFVYERMKTVYNRKMVKLITDGESGLKEYAIFKEWCANVGLKHVPADSQTHWKATARVESHIGRIEQMGKAMLHHRGLPQEFLMEAEQYANMITNATPSSVLADATPNQSLDIDFDYGKLHMFGAICYAKRSKTQRRKKWDASRRYIFLGYEGNKVGCKCYSLITKKVTYIAHPIFEEHDNISDAWLYQMQNGLTISSRQPVKVVTVETNDTVQGEILPKPTEPVEDESDEDASEDDDSASVDGTVSEEPAIRTSSRANAGKRTSVRFDSDVDATGKPLSSHISSLVGSAKHFVDDDINDGPKLYSYMNKQDDKNDFISERLDGIDQNDPVVNHKEISKNEKTLKLKKLRIPPSSGKKRRRNKRLMTYISEKAHPTLKRTNYPKASTIHVPKNEKEVLESEYAEEWREAKRIEIETLKGHDTFKFVDKPTYCHIINTKFVYAVKHDHDGNVTRFKARLVAMGFRQVWGSQYKETFAPVAHESTIKFLLAYAAVHGYETISLDYHGAFVHSLMPSQFRVYINTPEGMVCPEGKVCMLHKSLYGTKNAGMLWNKDWTKSMLKMGFRQSAYDPCLFIKDYGNGKFCYAVGWVDDVIFAIR